jgi:Ca2+-binding RTX toxin-like protein
MKRLLVAVIVAAFIALGTVGVAYAQDCLGSPATIVGTEGNDILTGTSGDDTLKGQAGYDECYNGEANRDCEIK